MSLRGAAVLPRALVRLGHRHPWAVLAGIILLTSLLTEVMSHAAAAVLIAPIAFNTAVELGVDPKPFFMAVATTTAPRS